MVYSEADVGLDLLHVRGGTDLPRWFATGRFSVEVVERSDHVFTRLESQQQLVDVVARWLARTADAMPSLGLATHDTAGASHERLGAS